MSDAEVYQDCVEKDEEGEELDEPCQWPCVPVPTKLQRLRDPKCFLFWMCVAGFAQSLAVNGYISATITTLERRYGLQGSQLGTIAAMYDLGVVITLLPVSYLGGRGRKPRWLAGGMFLIGLGSFVFTLPHFLAGEYQYSNPVEPLCYADEQVEYPDFCRNAEPGIQNYKYLFYLGQLLHGMGASPLYTIGIVYLDENLSTNNTGLFLAIFYLMTLLGPAVGFLSGGAFLTLFVDIGKPHPGITMQHTTVWVGAWWIGFLITGTLAWITVIPFMGFPASLPGRKAIEKSKKNEAFGTGMDTSHGLSGLSKFKESSKILMTNLPFLFLSLCGALEAQLINALGTFCPKFFEIMFAVPASRASILIGYTLVPAGGLAMLIGGIIIKKTELGVHAILRFVAIGVFIGVVAYMGFLIRCDTPVFHGVDYSASPYKQELSSQCNSHCQCKQNKFMFLPTCATEANVNFYSPCYAGCTEKEVLPDGQFVYRNCSCVAEQMYNYTDFKDMSSLIDLNTTAESGSCEIANCSIIYLFQGLFAIMIFSTFIVITPTASAVLRVVPANQRAYATGIQWILIRLLGSIPAPIYVGALIDRACSLWSDTCDSQGACSNYDQIKMHHTILGTFLSIKGMALVFMLLSVVTYKKSHDLEFHNTEVAIANGNGHAADETQIPLKTFVENDQNANQI